MKLFHRLITAMPFMALAFYTHASIVPSIDYTFGSGTESIFFVVDWNDGPDDNLNWQLNYNNGDYANVYDAMVALEGLDANLTFDFTDFGGALGQFLDGIAFSQPAPPISHDQNRGGGFAETFRFFTGVATGNTWTSASNGISGTAVTDGEAYGFSWGAFPQSAPNAIPEPGVMFLSLGGIGVLIWLRRLQKHR